jgi:hypothetical protein
MSDCATGVALNSHKSVSAFGATDTHPCKLTEDKMKQIITITMLAVGVMTAFTSIPVQAQRNQVCIPGRGCVRATQAAYNSCFELSQARGVSEQRNRAETWFIYQCLKGKIPRGSQ